MVGYGEQRQGNVTGALTNVTSEEFNKGRIVTPTELIQNKVAGVQVVENTEPGGKTSIRIRGGTSTTASNEPLYVIDGQPLTAGAGATLRARSPQLPQSRRHRQHDGAARRRGGGDLWHQRGQRRGPDHHQAGAGRPADEARVHRLGVGVHHHPNCPRCSTRTSSARPSSSSRR